jgi:uncharacterized protein DUF1844
MTMDEDKQEKRGFKVEDRRRFSDTGEARNEAPDPERNELADSRTPVEPSPQSDAPAGGINFTAFLLSLSTQALAYLGEIPDPINQRHEVDLVAAKQMIDILGILKEKTKGNLDKAEDGLLESVLYDLRLKYVERARSSPRA